MIDRVSKEVRSKIMSKIRGKDTTPELRVRKKLYSLGYRYRLHEKRLPGSPDIVFLGRKIAIFVHGCFWHQHSECKSGHVPETRSEFWQEKFDRNIERDKRSLIELEAMGWKSLVIWECEVNNDDFLEEQLINFLGSPSKKENR